MTKETVYKTGYLTRAAPSEPGAYEFTLSTPAVDSYGDVVKAPWKLDRFKKNPIALWMHDTRCPIGTWEKVRMEGENLVGQLRLAARGTSELVDQAWALIEQNIIKAVSVGFRVGTAEPIDPKAPWDGFTLTNNTLIECSLVSIPANEEALRRHFARTPDGYRLRSLLMPKQGVCVAGSACEQLKLRSQERETTSLISIPSRTTPMTLADRIKAKQTELNDLQDQVEQISEGIDGSGALSEDQQLQLDELALRMEKASADLATFERTEKALARKTGDTQASASQSRGETPRIQLLNNKPKGHRAFAAIAAIVKANGLRMDPAQVARENYKDQQDIELVVRAATAPATTTDSTWAANLIRETWGEFIELLRDVSVYPQLPGMRVDFANTLNLPVQNGRGALAGGFVAENGAIPVKAGSIGTTSLIPKKMAVISAYSKELARRSMPSVESIVQQQILADTAEVLDTILLSNGARSATSPAGLQDTTETGAANINAVTNVATGAHGSTVKEILTDTAAVLTRVWAIRARTGVWVMNPAQRLALEDKQDATTGHFVFRDEIATGNFRGYPIIESTNVTSGVVAFVANNAVGFGSELMPFFEVSDSATLHFDGASPLAIGTVGTPNTVAAPTISTFQQDLFAIKMVMSLDWRILRQAGVQVLTGATGW